MKTQIVIAQPMIAVEYLSVPAPIPTTITDRM